MIPKEIFDKISDYVRQIWNIHQKAAPEQEADANSVYLSLAEDDAEKDDIRDLCEDVDFYYEERAKLKASKKKAYGYLEQRVTEMFKEDNPNATDEECNRFLDEVRDTLDHVIASNANVFARETDARETDDSETVEKLLQQIEDKLKSGENLDLPNLADEKGKEAENEQ